MADHSASRRAGRRLRALAVLVVLATVVAELRRRAMATSRADFEARYGPGADR